jgi:hypothetical protein
MKKITIIIAIILGINNSYSQVTNLEIVTKQNDTLKNVELKMNFFTRVELNYKLQEKLVIIDNAGNKKELLPSEVNSFSFKYDDDIYNYESLDNKIFAQPLYKNKLKLFRFIKSGYTSINFYIIVRPNNGKISYMEAMGLSRLISKKVINREITDCPVTINKVESKELKINGEEGVVELIIDYETNCYSN